MIGAKPFRPLANERIIETRRFGDDIEPVLFPEFFQRLHQPFVDVIGKVLIYDTVVAGKRIEAPVEQDELAVRNPHQRLDRTPLRGFVERKVRGDDIIIELVEVFVDIVFEQVDLLVVQTDSDLPPCSDRRGERAEQHLLVGAQFVEQHQYLGILPAVFG